MIFYQSLVYPALYIGHIVYTVFQNRHMKRYLIIFLFYLICIYMTYIA